MFVCVNGVRACVCVCACAHAHVSYVSKYEPQKVGTFNIIGEKTCLNQCIHLDLFVYKLKVEIHVPKS